MINDTSYFFPTSTEDTRKITSDSNKTRLIANIPKSIQCIESALTTKFLIPRANSDLLQFIEKQESYIEQLEHESKFCRVNLRFLTKLYIYLKIFHKSFFTPNLMWRSIAEFLFNYFSAYLKPLQYFNYVENTFFVINLKEKYFCGKKKFSEIFFPFSYDCEHLHLWR